MNTTIILKNVRLAFSDNLVVAKSLSGGKPRFTANFIIEDDAMLKVVRAAVEEIAKVEFAGKTPTGKDCCLRDGNDNVSGKTGEVYSGFEGKFYLSGSRAEKLKAPLVVNGRKEAVQPGDAGFPQAGDYVNAKVSLYSINGKNDKGGDKAHGKKICCGIEVVQFLRKGESFGAGAPTTDGLDTVDEDPTADL